jgi:predicted metal-dependent hydrolase
VELYFFWLQKEFGGQSLEIGLMETLKLGDTLIRIEYKRIKNLRMTIYPPDGKVCISAPINVSQDVIRNFAASKSQWIEKYRIKYRSLPHAANSFQNREIHYVWGAAHELELIERKGHPKITLSNGRMLMSVPPRSTRAKKQELLNKWYRTILRETAPAVIRKWEAVIGVTVKELYARKMKSHWGSCNYKNRTIRLNTELAKKSPECLEYVTVHEMIHMLEPHHNPAFYRLMNTYLPSWKTIRKKMNKGEV